MALERRDVDRHAGLVTVRRTVVDGKVRPYGKTNRSLRVVPLPARAALALTEHPARLDSPLLFPARKGGSMDLAGFRSREWYPALRAAGIDRRVVYALRHTYASVAIAAGVSLFELSRLMGTSAAMLDPYVRPFVAGRARPRPGSTRPVRQRCRASGRRSEMTPECAKCAEP